MIKSNRKCGPGKMRIGSFELFADRWPWQWDRKIGWWDRFGGGWRWKLGIDIASTTIIVNLIWGSIGLRWKKRK